MEHLHHFKLSEDPFRNEPLLRYRFESRQQREALRRLDRGVRQAKGLSVLIGAVGSGKTMTVRQLLEDLEEEVFEASMLVVLNGAADASWMLTRYAKQLGIEDLPQERESLIAEIYDRLAIIREDGRHAVLIVDDAQALATPATLAEVCGLLKLEYEDRRLLSLVLAGTPRLDEALASEPMLAHRVDVKVHLEPLDAETAASYLAHRLRSAGGSPSVIEPRALSALHELGCGIPGLMNTLADNALFEAFLCGRDAMTETDVQRAYCDLGWEPIGVPQIDVPVNAVLPEVTAERSAPPPASRLSDLDSELEAVFAPSAPSFVPEEGPPKEEEPASEDLLVELLED